MMNSIFRELLHKGILANYMDDFMILAFKRKDSSIPENSREAQSVFQKIKIRLQHGGNPYPRGGCWQRTDSNETRKDQGSERMKDANKSKRHEKLSRVFKFLLMLYTKLQLHCQAIKQTKRQERVEVGRETPKSI